MSHRILLDRFPGGRPHAVTLSYDDGAAADRVLAPLLDRYGLRCTFCLNAGTLGQAGFVTPEELPQLYRRHEVASHSLRHLRLTELEVVEVLSEVREDRALLSHWWGRPIRGFSYPYGGYNEVVRECLHRCGLRYARTVAATGDFSLPQDLLTWHPTCRHREGLLARAEEFLRRGEQERGLLFFLWGHSYEFEREDNWALMEAFCDRLAGREDIWFATNGEIADYLCARRKVILLPEGQGIVNPSGLDIWVSVDGEAVQIPPGGRLCFP